MTLSVALPFDRVGLVVVDMQNGFCHPDGAIGRALGAAAVAAPAAIVPKIVGLMNGCRAAGVPIWLTRQVHYPGDVRRAGRLLPSHLERHGVEGLCARGSWDAELLDEVRALVRSEDEVLVKHRASAFYGTSLEVQLRMRGVQVLVVSGTTTSFCVDSTIRDAYARDFDVVVPADAVGDSDAELQHATLRAVARFHGTVTTVEEVIRALHVGARSS